MKKTLGYLLGAAAWVLVGICAMCMPGHGFFGYLCFGAAAVVLCYWFFALCPGRLICWLRRGVSALLVVGTVLAAVAGILIAKAQKGEPEKDCRYVIVLGAGVNGTRPSLILQERLETARSYLEAHPDAICIVTGGQGPGEEITEAVCMQTYLVEKGIDPDRIWMEDKATSTWENFNFSLELIREKTGEKPTSAGVVSNEFHLYRAGLMAEKLGLTAVGIPAKTSWVSLYVTYFLREIAAVWKHILLGG